MPQKASQVFTFGESLILKALGPNRLREFKAVRIPGELVWFNFELARRLGFDIPSTNAIPPKLKIQIMDYLSVRTLRFGDEQADREPVSLYADKYGGDDLGSCRGAGRAGFLPWHNLYLKGVGHTPLFRHDDPTDFDHSHGGASMLEGMLETVFGEVNTRLFTRGSARILALVDQGDYTIYPNGKREPRAIVVRAGVQLRPAHLFARAGKGGYSKLELFTQITRIAEQLVMRKTTSRTKLVPDLKATMLRVIDDHALTAAEQFRWRIVHGALSLSNMEMSGAMLDATTESAQPRTAPMRVLIDHDDINLVYGREHLGRAYYLQTTYRSLLKCLSKEQREKLDGEPINFTSEMSSLYNKHLEVQMLRAAGLPIELAKRIQAHQPELANRFKRILIEMATLRNRGSVDANKPPVEHISVLDIFNLLREYAAAHFAKTSRNNNSVILELLEPAFVGNHFRRAKEQARVEKLIQEFGPAYSELMSACERLAAGCYKSSTQMRRDIIARAAYENRPLTSLYRGNLLKQFATVIRQHKSNPRSEIISETISEIVSASQRKYADPERQ